MGAIQFIENLDRTALNITDDEFERNVENAVSAMAERDPASGDPAHDQAEDDEARAFVHGPNEWSKSPKAPEDPSRRIGLDPGESSAAGSILQSVQRPLNSIGRIFSDGTTAVSRNANSGEKSDRYPVTSPTKHADGATSNSQSFSSLTPDASASSLQIDANAASRPSGGLDHDGIVEYVTTPDSSWN